MKKIVFLILLFTGIYFAAEKTDPVYKEIRGIEIYQLCQRLCGDDFRGRLTGDAGYTKAANWTAQLFKKWGLQPFEKKYLHDYQTAFSLVNAAEMKLFIFKSGSSAESDFEEVKLEPLKDFFPLLFSDSGDAEAGLVFAGWGISAAELGYDDYQYLNVAGKFVLCFRGVPDNQDPRFQHYDEHRVRMQTAFSKGARGLIYIYPEIQANPNGDRISGFLGAQISEKAADRIFSEKGINCSELKKDLQTYKVPLSFELKSRLKFFVKADYFPQATGYNVAGFIEGSDKQLRHELIVIGAHLDHVGTHLGYIFYGANDNASGSAVVLSLAKAFAGMNRKPKRSLLFVLFGGEEQGLQGSTDFAGKLAGSSYRVKLMINLDMEGAGDQALVFYSSSEQLKGIIERADKFEKSVAVMREIKGVGVRGSDYAPFFSRGVPCISVFSNGPHLNYHQPGDSIFRINPAILEKIARFTFLTTLLAAE